MTARVKVSLVCAAVTVALALAAMVWGTAFSITGNEMAYALLCYFIVLPMLALGSGFVLGWKRAAWRWLYVPLVGILGLLMPLPVFGSVWFIVPFFGVVPAAAGLLAGLLFMGKKGQEEEESGADLQDL